MIHGAWVSCAMDGTTSAECDLGRVYEKVMVQLPTLAQTGTNTVTVQGGKYSGDTFKNVYTYIPSTGAVVVMQVANTAGGFMAVFPIGGFQFIKLVCGETQDVTFYCQGVRS